MMRFLGSVWEDTKGYAIVALVLFFVIALVATVTFADRQTLDTINQIAIIIEGVCSVTLMLICASMFFRFLFDRLQTKWRETK